MKSRNFPSVCLLSVLLVVLPNAVRAECGTCAESLCGPRSLLTVCQELGVPADMEQLKTLSGYDQKVGASLLSLQQAAKAVGLQAIGVKISVDELAHLPVPGIALLWDAHFVVTGKSGQPGWMQRETSSEGVL